MSEIKTEMSDKERIVSLENQVQALLLALQAQKPVNNNDDYNRRVTIVNLVERVPPCSTLIQLSNLVVSMVHFGEERTLTLQQFEELVGKYRGWFDSGMIAVGAADEEIAQRYGVQTNAKYPIKSDFLQNLGNVPMPTLEDTFARLPIAGQESIISYWSREARKGNPQFRDVRKLETLNRVSGGKMGQLISEFNLEDRKQTK